MRRRRKIAEEMEKGEEGWDGRRTKITGHKQEVPSLNPNFARTRRQGRKQPVHISRSHHPLTPLPLPPLSLTPTKPRNQHLVK